MRTRLSPIAAHAGTASWLLVATVSFGVLLPGMALAWNAVHSNHEVTLCYVPGGGTVYLIKEPDLRQECSSPQHTELVVNAQGMPGPPGPPGPAGPQGPEGPAGDPGPVAGWELVFTDVSLNLANPHETAFVLCPAGKWPMGGGFAAGGHVHATSSEPLIIIGGWSASFVLDTQNSAASSGRAWAVCAEIE